MSIFEAIDDFKTNYNKIMQDFSIIDDSDPITPEKLTNLIQAKDQLLVLIQDVFTKKEKYFSEHEKKNQALMTKYEQKIKALSDSLNRNMKNITKDHIEACQKLKTKNEVSKKDTNYRIEQLEVELDYFLATSEQNKIILNNDYAEAKKRFDYQRDESKESYLDIVKKNNEILKNVKDEIISKYETERANLLKNQEDELNRLRKNLELQEVELSSISGALDSERSNMKEKYRHESANLNENIKRISEDKNKIIDKARSQYNKSINDANIEKENKKVVYQNQSQALLREFVTKINIIDENTAAVKKEFEKKTNEIKRDYYIDIFNKTKEFHQQLQPLLLNNPIIDKYTNHLIKYKNKLHQFNMNISKKEKELLLLDLSKDNTIKILNNRYDKNFLEIDKNYAIKKITDQEQFDNKFYQENDNIYENDFNYTVKTANYRFSQQANLLRCQSQIRTKLLERNFDGISANYYKKIEAIQNKIAASKLTIEITERLNKLLLQYMEETFCARLHLEETRSLLEIEKNKLLKGFNQSQYDHNISNITLSREYGFKKIDLENQKAAENKNLRIILENLILDKNCASTDFSIKKEELNENFAKIKTQIINNNDLKVAKEDYITKLLENDTQYLEQIVFDYAPLYDEFKKTYFQIIQLILKGIKIEDKNYHFMESFLNSVLKLYLNLSLNLSNEISSSILTILDQKINYIYEFKYKASLDSLEEQHTKEIEHITAKKNEILDKIDSYDKTIENFKQKIFTLINDNEMLLHNNQSQTKKKKLDSKTLSSIRQTELKIKDYKEKIDDFTQMNRMHSDDLLDLNKKLLKLNREYKTELQKFQKLIQEDIFIYEEYKKSYVTQENRLTHMINHMMNHMLASPSVKKFESTIHSFVKAFDTILDYARTITMNNYSRFIKASIKDTQKREKTCSTEFSNDVNSFNQRYNKATLEYLTEYHNTIATHEKKIEDQTNLLNQMMAHYDHKLFLANESFQADSNTLEFIQQQLTNEFFASYYALDDNYQKIIQYHQDLNVSKKNQYLLDKENLNKERNDKINELNQKLKGFIRVKNEEIEHLPIAFKFNSKILNRETKKKNIQLHEDLKQAKNNYANENKHIEKNIRNLKYRLTQDQIQNELNQKRSIIKEKKNNSSNLKQSLRSLRINL